MVRCGERSTARGKAWGRRPEVADLDHGEGKRGRVLLWVLKFTNSPRPSQEPDAPENQMATTLGSALPIDFPRGGKRFVEFRVRCWAASHRIPKTGFIPAITLVRNYYGFVAARP